MHKIYFKNRLVIRVSFLAFFFSITIAKAETASTISCHQGINISLNDNCESTLYASDILTVPPSPAEPHILELTSSNGTLIQNNLVDASHLWTTIMAKVTNTVSGNSCWGSINIEDKNPPTIMCQSVTIPCFDAQEYLPTHFDNCSSSRLELIGETIIPNSCSPSVIKVIQRTWTAIDSFGNKAEPCLQTISLERLDFTMIDYPEDLLVEDMNNLTCENVVFDENGFPSLEMTGVPSIDGVPLYPIQDIYCNIGIDYEDFLVTDESCIQKYMRTWRIYESFCTGSGNFATIPQVIEVSDTELPTITCPLPSIISTDGGSSCTATTTLPLPTFSDDCSGGLTLNISYSGPFLKDVEIAPTVVLNIGVNEIEYTVYDACENTATCVSTIRVDDNTAPTAHCDDSKIVSLRSTGTAYAYVASFDNGSTDDCSFYKSIIKRDDNKCDCELPEFDDMQYVGENDGKYYYISTIERFGFEAFAYSKAFGGSIAMPKTQVAYDWLVSEVQKTTDEPFLIGLKDDANSGQYKWNDHTTPVYTDWEFGQPDANGSNVVVNTNGNWEVLDGSLNRAYFVTEFDDICGFSERVYFCCEDGLEDPTLTLRAIDRFGRYNECTITVEIQDKVAPVIICPSNRSLDCSTQIDTANLDVYGIATATDECLQGSVTSTFTSNVSDCGVGEIVRTFIASDPTGSSTCQQTISLNQDLTNGVAPIKWPEDYTSFAGCNGTDLLPENLPLPNGFPDFNAASCSSLSASYRDDEYNFAASGSDACLKILRTWTVMDHCLVDVVGYSPETYQQTIKVINTEGPTIRSGCENVVVESSNCNDAQVSILVDATDDCTSADNLRGSLQIDIYSDGSGIFDIELDKFDGTVTYVDDLPIGEHFALISFVDECGNPSSCTKQITVENNLPPVARCVSGLTTSIQQMDTSGNGVPDTEMTMIFASMLDKANASTMVEGSNHPCMFDFNFSFSADLNDTVAIFNCDNVGVVNTLTLRVTDEFGNFSTCNATVDILDENLLCGSTANKVDINGAVVTELNTPIENVDLLLEGSDYPVQSTLEDGQFAFPQMPIGGFYSIVPEKNDDPLNGVSTLDLVLMQRHILGIEKLNSPYKLIAADVNNSGSITAIDLIELRKLILGVNESFTNNDSWKIINGEYEFIEEQNPDSPTLPTSYDIYKLEQDMDVHFTGIKIGDLDNSARSNSLENIGRRARTNQSVSLKVDEVKLQMGHTQTLKFWLDDISVLDGFQLALDIDSDIVEIIAFRPTLENMSMANINQNSLQRGDIRVSWHDLEYELLNQAQLFEIVVKARQSVNVSDIIEVAYENLMPEIYYNSNAQPLDLIFEGQESENDVVTLYQNAPNPWSDLTSIKFYTPKEEDYRFSLFDVNGRLVYQQFNDSQEGMNIIELDKSMINQSGVLYYEIQIGQIRLMDKMILIN